MTVGIREKPFFGDFPRGIIEDADATDDDEVDAADDDARTHDVACGSEEQEQEGVGGRGGKEEEAPAEEPVGSQL